MSLTFEIKDATLFLKGDVTLKRFEKQFKAFKKAYQVKQAEERGANELVKVNWDGVSKLDSTCLAFILWLQSQQSQPLQMSHLPEHLKVLVELYDLSTVFQLDSES